jgi:hypothetical protein
MQELGINVPMDNFFAQIEQRSLHQLDHDISLSFFSLLYGYASLGLLGDVERLRQEAQSFIGKLNKEYRMAVEANYVLALGRAGDVSRMGEVIKGVSGKVGEKELIRFKAYGLAGRILSGVSIHKLLSEIKKIVYEDTDRLVKHPHDVDYGQQNRLHGEWANWVLDLALRSGIKTRDWNAVKKIVGLGAISDESLGNSLNSYYQHVLGISPVMMDDVFDIG